FDKLASLCGEVVNIGTGVQRSLAQVVDAVLAKTKANVQCHWGSMPARIWDAKTWVADCTKSHRLLDWRSTTSLNHGIARTVEWMQSRQDLRERAWCRRHSVTSTRHSLTCRRHQPTRRRRDTKVAVANSVREPSAMRDTRCMICDTRDFD